MSRKLDPESRELPIPQLLGILEQTPPSSRFFENAARILDSHLVPDRAAPPDPTPPGPRRFLTIGMATYDDYDGVYFSVQALRLYHPEIAQDIQILVLDNHPGGPCSGALKNLGNFVPGYRYVPHRSCRGTATRDVIFREANSLFVLVMDSHVLFAPGSLARLIEFLKAHPESNDLWQGPLLYDDLTTLSTHFAPEWSDGMYGVWRNDERGSDPAAPPFEIPMQGLGAFVCRRQAWPGFNPRLSGFGGEEGYIHEKIRRRGGAVVCLPFLRWVHRFDRPLGTRYPLDWKDRIRNYLIEYDELGLDPAPVLAHFAQQLGADKAGPLVEAVMREIAGPFHGFDAIYQPDFAPSSPVCTILDTEAVGLEARIRHVPFIRTPYCKQIGRALMHRSIIEEARRLELKNVLILEDNFEDSPETLEPLRRAGECIRQPNWPGGCFPGALAFGNRIFARVMAEVPPTASGVALWLRRCGSLDSYYAGLFGAPVEGGGS